jgi:hypothetical protein
MGSLQDELKKSGLIPKKPKQPDAPVPTVKAEPKKKTLEEIVAERERRARADKKRKFRKADRQLQAMNEAETAQKLSMPKPSELQASAKKTDAPEKPKPIRKPDLGPVIKSRIARAGDFKKPDPWVADGKDLFGPFLRGPDARSAQIYLGIDFGTAFTKAAIGFSEKIFIVDWAGLSKSESEYLLAGEVSEFPANRMYVGRSEEARATHGNLKLPFLNIKTASNQEKAFAVCFLAWVMRYMRAWVFKNMRNVIGNRKPAWTLNLGLPAESVDNLELSTSYEDVAKAAWILSMKDAIAIDDARLAIEEAEKKPATFFGLEDLQLQPEFLAQIAGYMDSPQRTDGMHLLVDIGAGTADCALFMHYRNKDGDFKNTVHRASVDPNGGSHFLLKNRFVKNEIEMDWDDLVRIPSAAAFARDLGIGQELVDKADRQFSNRLNDQLVDLILYTKKETYPLAPEWCPNSYGGPPEGLKYFLVGGGSECGVFGTTVLSAAHRATGAPARKAIFPVDQTLETPIKDPALFQRVSVAYGLARDTTDFGELQNAEKAKEIAADYAEMLSRVRQSERSTHEDLYSD